MNKRNNQIGMFYYIFLIVLLISSQSFGFAPQKQEKSTYVESYYEPEVFIDVDYIFNENDGIYIPKYIRINPVTKEIVVLAKWIHQITVFTHEGKFVRIIGHAGGQGPGDLLRPACLSIDREGNIYIYEEGNYRLSIFSKTGKFINSFRVDLVKYNNRLYMEMSFGENGEILLNTPKRGYYITEFSKEGEVIKNIYKMPDISNNKNSPIDRIKINQAFAEGHPFIDSEGKYYFFHNRMPVVKIFDNDGSLIEEVSFHDSRIFEGQMKRYVSPEKYTFANPLKSFFQEVLYINDKFYCLIMDLFDKDGHFRFDVEPLICVLDKELNIIELMHLKMDNVKKSIDENEVATTLDQLNIAISEDQQHIYFPNTYMSEILRFRRIR